MKLFSKKMEEDKKTKLLKNYLLNMSSLPIEDVYEELKTNSLGLDLEEIEERIKTSGKNTVASEKPLPWYWMILLNFTNPFILVLLILGFVSYITEDIRATIVVSLMVALSVLMRFIQEYRSSRAAETLRIMVRIKCTVKRIIENENEDEVPIKMEIPLEELVPGDIIYLSAGDMIPADIRLIRSKDLFVGQSALTGESMPVEKFVLEETAPLPPFKGKEADNPMDKSNLCFMGTSVISGYGEAIVIATGENTFFGSLAKSIIGYRPETSFDKGINSVTWILIKFIAIMVPIIFIINGVIKGEWRDSFLFALAVAVGLTPEMLPMIVTANLAKGAVAMSRFKVIVKRLNSIQSLGAMDILCTDKTGTLTQDKIILEKYLNTSGEESERILDYGFLNSYYQSGLKNMLDKAILDHKQIERQLNLKEYYRKIDEIPFDFIRKRLSVIISKEDEPPLLICKGAVDELLKVCTYIEYKDEIEDISEEYIQSITHLAHELSDDGFRVIAVAYQTMEPSHESPQKTYTIHDENNLVLLGLMAFLDPPKETACDAIQILKEHNVKVKVLTGDNEIITKRVCKEVNLPIDEILLGTDIDNMDEKTLSEKIENTTIFAKLTPFHKSRIIKSLQSKDHIVGFLGDGINDASALRDADVGISVDTATDIARESADIILLEKSLLVLGEGVVKGREVYGNIIKYIKMAASSNFGNVISVLIASAMLPFLPILPLQILIQNLLYDFSQLTIPWDRMDKEFLKKTRRWDPSGIARFMIFIGPISSIFDMTTFALLWYVYGANSVENQALFQSGWFMEGLISQTLIVHMIRTRKIPFIQSMATFPLVISTILIILFGLYLPYSSFASAVGLVPLPHSYFLWLAATLLSYCVLVQLVKVWYIRRFKTWL